MEKKKQIEIDIKEVQRCMQDTFSMPKIELHAHIGGCFRPSTFMELVMLKGADLDKVDFYKVTIEGAFEFFKITSQLLTDLVTLKRIVYEIIEDFSKQNTRYLELRSTPKPLKGSNSTSKEYIEAICEVMERAEEEFDIKVRYLVSINRQAGIKAAQETFELVKAVKSPYICGIELSGDPRQGCFADYSLLLAQIRQETGLKVSLHCSETPEQQGESEEMIDFKPERLGHCCFLTEEQLERVHSLAIPVEVCPTSNLAVVPEAGNIVSYLPHLRKLHDLKHNFIICTDDTMLFSTNISTELFEYAKGFKASSQELKDLMLKNVDAIFDDSCKEWLREKIQSYRV